ncbi:WHG domain-containing protein [Saccharopolyspora sp. K220]|uniref:TetR/AcrR family transcriptional regulator n=1 Tax=Saccharopolyspora soli TaxID=2926618 RepID=UPI001F5AD054|nr:TetR-like C-terminal domain-containing protein [Saccharopolyspora soli]MCI2417920.1 WHG domain-containing protein [Saccharopolyspora soli]
MAGGRYHHGDLRAALLDSAATALRTSGVDALSLRELARDIGVSHAAPRRHFKDKAALLNALALRGFERLSDEIGAAAASSGPFRVRIAAMASAYVRFAAQEAELLELMFVRKLAPDATEELLAAGHDLGAVVFAVIADGQRSGDVHPGNAEAIALAVFSALHGFASLAATGIVPTATTTDQALDYLLDELLHGLTPR